MNILSLTHNHKGIRALEFNRMSSKIRNIIWYGYLSYRITDIFPRIYKIKTGFGSPEGPKSRSNKTGIYFMIFT